jgi:nucleotide-binding universal stress UspA family protein
MVEALMGPGHPLKPYILSNMLIERIVLAVDGSDGSRKAADAALAIADRLRCDVVVVNVADLYYSGAAAWTPGRSEELETFLSAVVDQVKAKGVNVRLDLRDAARIHVGQEIVNAASEVDADIIIIGSRGLSRLPSFLLGSVTTRVLHLATCPVLVVPEVT